MRGRNQCQNVNCEDRGRQVRKKNIKGAGNNWAGNT